MIRLHLDQYATAGITRNQVDNRDLVNSWSYNLISEIDCLPTSTTNDINEDLRLGQISKDRYSKGMLILNTMHSTFLLFSKIGRMRICNLNILTNNSFQKTVKQPQNWSF